MLGFLENLPFNSNIQSLIKCVKKNRRANSKSLQSRDFIIQNDGESNGEKNFSVFSEMLNFQKRVSSLSHFIK